VGPVYSKFIDACIAVTTVPNQKHGERRWDSDSAGMERLEVHEKVSGILAHINMERILIEK